MKDVFENILTRKSCRSFGSKKVQKEDLDQILEAAVFAPSAMNKQSWQFTVLQDEKNIQELAAAVGKALGSDNYDFYKPTAFIMVSNKKDNSNGLADCSCALQNIFLAAHALGIDSCWINQMKDVMEDETVSVLLRRFGVPENHKIWGSAALGYTTVELTTKERKRDVIVYAD